YDALGNRITSRNKLGAVTNYAYDRRGLLVEETLPQATYLNDATLQSSTIVNKFEYDARGNRTKLIEAFGLAEQRDTVFVYDKNNRLVETRGEARSVLDQNNHTSVTTAFVPVEAVSYDARGNIIRTIDAAGAKSLFFYDDLNRKTAEVNAAGTYTKYSYDKNGNVTNIRIYEHPLTLPEIPATGGNAAAGEALLIYADGLFRETVFSYDNLNRMVTSSVTGVGSGYWNGSLYITSAAPLTTSYVYDANGNVVSLTDPNGRATYSYYDRLGRKTA
ncbi:hypothetical protein ACFOWX_13325, partial [Sphingorhabdus arenilitoris]